jgi:hypothetical protein
LSTNQNKPSNRDGAPQTLSHHNEILESFKDLRGKDFVEAVLNSPVGINDILISEEYVKPTMYNDSAAEFYHDFSTPLTIACLNQDQQTVEELLKHGAHVTRYVQLPDGSTGTWRDTFVVHRMPSYEPHILHIFLDTYPDRIGIGRREDRYLDEVNVTRTRKEIDEEYHALAEAIMALEKELNELQDLHRKDSDRALTAEELKHFSDDVLWIKKRTFSEMCQNISRNIESKRERQKTVRELLGIDHGNANKIIELLRVAAKKELSEALTSKSAPQWMKISALFYGIQTNDLGNVQKLLDQGLNLDVGGPGGTTAVGLAIELSNAEALELLVKAGATVDMPCAWAPRLCDPDEQDSGDCFTPMFFAVGCGWVQGVKILLKCGVGALTGYLHNEALSDLKRYKVVQDSGIDVDETLDNRRDSSGSEEHRYMFVGQTAWLQRGLGGSLHWALESTQPWHAPHWPKRSVKTQKELLKLLGDTSIEEINTLRSQSKRVTPVHWRKILNDLIRALPLGKVAVILGKRWDEAEDFMLGYFDEEISTRSSRADLAIDYAKHVYDEKWPDSFDLIHGR